MSVNVSANSLADPGYADAVTQIVTGHGLDPSQMILELTETEAILNIAAALENLTRLRIRGFGLAAAAAALLRAGDDEQIRDDLRRFKQLLETGEVVRSEASPEGTSAVNLASQRPAQPLPG